MNVPLSSWLTTEYMAVLITNRLGGDNIRMKFRVYIEGVEVPFESASIQNVYQNLPSATISIPPYQGLEQLGRNYFPKVHIFYLDPNEGVKDYSQLDDNRALQEIQAMNFSGDYASNLTDEQRINLLERSGYKLIFSGVIMACSESKQMARGGASQNISLMARHPLSLLDQIMIRYTGTQIETQSDANNKVGVAVSSWINQPNALMFALQGIRKGGKPIEEDESGFRSLSESMNDRFERLKGCPGAIVVLWNMLKRDVFHRGLQTTNVQAFKDMYIPLVEEGLRMFNKMTGHDVIEGGLQSSPSEVPKEVRPEKGTQEELKTPETVILPPAYRTFVSDAATTMLATTGLMSLDQGDEALNFSGLISRLLQFIQYDMVVLGSPASLASKRGEVVETILKPHMPYYYAPICNVVLPNMYDSYTIQHNSHELPTRVVLQDTMMMGERSGIGRVPDPSYVAPHSVRVGISDTDNLQGTLITYNNKVGRYEWGKGIVAQMGQVPEWYSFLGKDLMIKAESSGESAQGEAGSNQDGMKEAIRAWDKVFPNKPGFNPWNAEANGIFPWQVWSFLEADFQYANRYAGSRTATVSGIFNPYIVVGYPMDVLDPSPLRSSYHGFCTSVTHEIHAQGHAATVIGMSACLSFEELVSCYIPIVSPWLSQRLGLAEDHRIFNNREAFKIACQYYHDVLGVGAADPYLLVNYELGSALPIERKGGLWVQAPQVSDGEDLSGRIGYHSVQGSLNLVGRNIVSLPQVEAEHADTEGRLFIDISMWNRGAVKTIQQARVDIMPASGVKTTGLSRGIELERSPFLVYPGDGEDTSLPSHIKNVEGE